MTDTVQSVLKPKKSEKTFLPSFPYSFLIILAFIFSIIGVIGFFMSFKSSKTNENMNSKDMQQQAQARAEAQAQAQAQEQAQARARAEAQAAQQQAQQQQAQQSDNTEQPQNQEPPRGFMQSSAVASLQCPVGAVVSLLQDGCGHCKSLLDSGELEKLGQQTLVLGVFMDNQENRVHLPNYKVDIKGFPCLLLKAPNGQFVELNCDRKADAMLQTMNNIFQTMQQQAQQQQ